MKRPEKYIIALITAVIFLMPFHTGCKKKMIKDHGGSTHSSSSDDGNRDNGNGTGNSGSIEKNRALTGDYRITVGGGFTGTLKLRIEDGRFVGSLKFNNWGKGHSEVLKKLKIKNNKIYFIRSITTPAELKKYGSTRYFKQQFFGKFYKNGNIIKGYLSDSGTETAWKAER